MLRNDNISGLVFGGLLGGVDDEDIERCGGGLEPAQGIVDDAPAAGEAAVGFAGGGPVMAGLRQAKPRES